MTLFLGLTLIIIFIARHILLFLTSIQNIMDMRKKSIPEIIIFQDILSSGTPMSINEQQ